MDRPTMGHWPGQYIPWPGEVDFTVKDEFEFRCRCMGTYGRDQCIDRATEEDGLCDECRHPEGTCFDTEESRRTRQILRESPSLQRAGLDRFVAPEPEEGA